MPSSIPSSGLAPIASQQLSTAAVQPYGSSGPRIRASVQELLRNHSSDYYNIEKECIDLTRNLVAMKLLDQDLFSEQNADLPNFDINRPVRSLRVGKESIVRQLGLISKTLVDDKRVLDGIWEIVNASGIRNRKTLTSHRFPMMCIDPDRAPGTWDPEVMLTMLRIGDWGKVDLSGADLAGQKLQYVQWRGYNLSGANLKKCNFWNSDLRDCNLKDANLREATLKDSKLGNSNLTNADLRSANMKRITADGAIFNGADMRAANAEHASFIGANFRAANLQDAILRWARFDNATHLECSQGTDFSFARLGGVKISIQKAPHRINSGYWPWNKNSKQIDLPAFRRKQFAAISSIDREQHRDLYLETLGDLIDTIKTDGHSAPPISLRVWLRNRNSWANPKIRSYIAETLLPPLLERWNLAQGSQGDPSPERVLHYLGKIKPALDWPRYHNAVAKLLNMSVPYSLMEKQTALNNLFREHPDTKRN